MPYVVTVDPKTGEKTVSYQEGEQRAAKPQQQQQQGFNPLQAIGGAMTNAMQMSPIGLAAGNVQMVGGALGAGLQEYGRTGDLGKAGIKAQQTYQEALEAPTPAATVSRVAVNAARNVAQELSDVTTADLPAALGVKGARPTTAQQPDAPFLGRGAPLPKLKSSGPGEDLATGIVQAAIEWFPAAKAVGLVGKGLKLVPGVASAGAAVEAGKAAYTTQKAATIAALPAKAQKPAAAVAGVGEAIASNVLSKSAATGAVVDVFGFDQHGGRLYDLADNLHQKVVGTPLEVPFLDYLKSKPGDVGMAGRLKNGIEGAGLGAVGEGIYKAFRAAKYVERLRNAPAEQKPAAAAAAAQATKDLEDYGAQQAQVVTAPRAVAPEVATVPTVAAPGVITPEVIPPGATGPGTGRTLLSQQFREGMNRPGQSIGEYTQTVEGMVTRQGESLQQRAVDLGQRAQDLGAEAAAIQGATTPAPVAKVKLTATQQAELENMNTTLMQEMGVNFNQGLTREQLITLEQTIRIDYASPEQGGIETVSAATRRSMLGLADKFKKVADELPAAITPEPSVPSAGTPEPAGATAAIAAEAPVAPAAAAVAGPTPEEIRQIDESLAMGMANRTPEERAAIRDQMLVQKYGTSSPAELPPAEGTTAPAAPAMAEAGGAGTPPPPPVEPPTAVQPSVPDDNWAQQLVDQMAANREALEAGDLLPEDILQNNVQKIVSPSGRTQYVPAQADMVQAYRAFNDTFTRADATGIPAMSFEAIERDTQRKLVELNFDGPSVLDNLKRLSGPLSQYQDNLVALRAAMLYTDHTNLQAGVAANKWLNAQADDLANMNQLTAELLTAAAEQKRANVALDSVTRPIAQLLASLQNPRPTPGTLPFGEVEMEPAKNLRQELEDAMDAETGITVADSIGTPISPELRDSILTGEYTPQAMAELDVLARGMAQTAVTPGQAIGFWDKFNKSVGVGARGLVMYRAAQLLSSGLTFWRNVIGNGVRLVQLPATQALGAAVQGEFTRASQSMLIYGQYVQNLQNSIRLGVESFKVGRGLFDLDASSADFLDRLAAQDADTNLARQIATEQGEWTLNTMPWIDVQDRAPWALAQRRIWQLLNLSTRMQVSADTFFKSMVGQSFEYVRNLQPGLDHAVQLGMKPGSAEAQIFARDYAKAAVDKTLRDVTVDGRTILDAVMDSPHAQTAMRWATYTDDIMAQMQPRTTTRGMELATAQGLEGEAATKFAQEYVAKGSEDTPMFTKAFSLMPAAWQKLIDFSPVFSVVQPFNRTPGDIVKSAARSTPLAPLVDTWWRDINSEDAFTRDRAIGDVALGSTAMALATLAVTQGNVEFTGGGPIDPTARRKWFDEGKQPYSFRVRAGEDENGEPIYSDWVGMQVFEPFATLFGAIGDYVEISNKLPVEAREKLGSTLVLDVIGAVGAGQLSKTYYQGFMQLYEAFTGVGQVDISPNKRNPIARYVENIVASMVPGSSALRAGRRIQDPTLRTVPPSNEGNMVMSLFNETLGELKNMIPGWSESLPPRLNWVTAEPQALSGVFADQFLPLDQPWIAYLFQFAPTSAFPIKAATKDPVMNEMAKLSGKGASFMGPRESDFGTQNRLDPYQFNEYIRSVSLTKDEFGRTLHDALLEEIQSERYQLLPEDSISLTVMGDRAASLNRIVTSFMKRGREDFLSKPIAKPIVDNLEWVEGRNRDVQFRLKYGQAIDPQTFVESLR